MTGRIAYVTLSKRNLKTLLAKLDGYPDDYQCTISWTIPVSNVVSIETTE